MRSRFSAMVLACVTSLAIGLFGQQSTLKVKSTNDTPKKAAPIGNGPAVSSASQNAKALQNIERESLKTSSTHQSSTQKAPPVTKVAEAKNPPINFGGPGARKAAALGGTDPYKGRLRTKGGDGHN